MAGNEPGPSSESLSHHIDMDFPSHESSQNPNQPVYDPDVHLPYFASETPSATLLPSSGNKRSFDEDEGVGNSSDAPIFSSDIMDPTEENYTAPLSPNENDIDQPPHKRYRQGTCWDSPSQGIQIVPCNSPSVTRSRSKRPFKRNIDSGVWMGSDTEMEDELEDLRLHGASPLPADSENPWIRKLKDSGCLNGPVFPSWEEQPGDLEQLQEFWIDQIQASEQVQKLIDEGENFLDFSNWQLTKLQESTLEPLEYYRTAGSFVPEPRPDYIYQPFIPDLQIYLANNCLTQLPGRLFQLEHLVVLSLRNNSLTELPSAICKLSSLRELNLSNNRLKWLPYELGEMVNGKLGVLNVHPNPFIRMMPKPSLPKSLDAPIGSTSIAYRNVDGSIARDSPPSPLTTTTYWPGPPHRLSNESIRDRPHRVSSLFELCLKAAYKSSNLDEAPLILPPDAPEAVRSAVQNTWRLKQQGGQQCTSCKSNFIIPRAEWIEWWFLPAERRRKKKAAIPFLRRVCSWGCVPEMPTENPGLG
ncbi:MAG: hypothetical protein Q9174_005386 [Haloplaca sp. 1 TL-2023]